MKRMKTIVLVNQKGGVGKTTGARHFTFHADEAGLRTLVVDLDPQRNLTRSMLQFGSSSLGVDRDADADCGAHLLFQQEGILRPMQINERISLVAGTRELINVLELPLASVDHARARLESLADDYDVCVIDTPPTMSNLLFAGIICAQYLVMPCDLDEDATSGLLDLVEQAEVIRQEFNPNLELVGVLLNKVNRRRAYDEAQRIAIRNEWGGAVLDVELSERSATKLAKKVPVWKNPRGESDRNAAREMRAVCKEVFNRVGL